MRGGMDEGGINMLTDQTAAVTAEELDIDL